MSTLAILQAGMTSTRLPGKVLRPLLGEPIMMRQIASIRRATGLDGIIVATSEEPSDDVVAELAGACESDVVQRFIDDDIDRFGLSIGTFAPDVATASTTDDIALVAAAFTETLGVIVDCIDRGDVAVQLGYQTLFPPFTPRS